VTLFSMPAIMATAATYPHLTTAEDGSIHIGNSRYKVVHLAREHYHYGWTAEELLRQHPDLRPEEVYSALAYFYDHYDEFLQALQPAVERESGNPTLTRSELLRRRSATGE
jgi:uncharacterized protein (DUF433 family)